MRIATEHRKCRVNGGRKRKTEEEREGGSEGGRERFDLDVWATAASRGWRHEGEGEKDRQMGGGRVKCLGDQIAERAIVAGGEGERARQEEAAG